MARLTGKYRKDQRLSNLRAEFQRTDIYPRLTITVAVDDAAVELLIVCRNRHVVWVPLSTASESAVSEKSSP